MDYKTMLSKLTLNDLKQIIKQYMSAVKITVSKKSKEELIEHILKHTEFKNNKITMKSHDDVNIETPKMKEKKQLISKKPEPKKPEPKVEPKKPEPKKPEPKKEEEIKYKNKIIYGVAYVSDNERHDLGSAINYNNVIDKHPYYLFTTKNDFELAKDNVMFVEALQPNLKKVLKFYDNKTKINEILLKIQETKEEPEPKKPEPKKPEPKKPEPKVEPDNKKQLIELNDKFFKEVDKIIKIKSPFTFQAYNDKNNKDSYFIKLLKEYEKNGTIKYNSKYDEIFKNLPKELYNKQQTEDFYPTPIACIKPFENDIKQAQNILEPTAGLGHIVNKIREINKEVKITAIEYTQDFSEILKVLNPDVEVIKKDFLSYNPDKVNYDLIIINPPFTSGNDSRYYMNFLFQCLYLINRTKNIYMPTIIFISPQINDKNIKNEAFFLNDIINSKFLSSKKLDEICKKYGLNPTKKQLEYLLKQDDNIFKKETDLEDAQEFRLKFENLFDFYQGDLIGQCQGFGGTSLKANLYRIVGLKAN